jgi:hypothetical protein
MKLIKHFVAVLLFVVMTVSSPGVTTYSGSKGTSSFSSSRSSSAPSAPAPSRSTWGSSNNSSKNTGWGGSNAPKVSTSNSGKTSSTDKILSSKSAMTFTVSRQQAVEQYKAQNAANYTTRFSNEPPTRPTYIPQQYVDPVQHTYHYIYYDSGHGGYGYWDLMGQFILYDALTEHAERYADTQAQVSYDVDYSEDFPYWLKLVLVIISSVIVFIVLGALIFGRNSAY